MLYLWTRDSGPQSFSVFASRRTPGMLRSGQLMPLQELELITTGAASSSVQRVREMYLAPPFLGDLKGMQRVAYSLMAEWLASVLAEGQNEAAYYDEFSTQLLESLDRTDTLAVVAECLAGLSRHLGFAPDPQSYRAGCLLDGSSGAWMIPQEAPSANAWRMGPASSALYVQALHRLDGAGSNYAEFLNDLATYFQVHLTGFRRPRYLSLLLST
jgi:DNA repair protein RecO (recombination protein O)